VPRIAAYVKEDGWAYVEEDGQFYLVKPPYLQDFPGHLKPRPEHVVVSAVTKHGWLVPRWGEETWPEIIQRLRQMMVDSFPSREEDKDFATRVIQSAPQFLIDHLLKKATPEMRFKIETLRKES
jgi:hypothetical protein